ncbi:zeta toxin family protein [Pseudomonas aeruginosa]
MKRTSSTVEHEASDTAFQFAIENRAEIARRIVDIDTYLPDARPLTFFMAGSPGAGKTEVSLNMISLLEKSQNQNRPITSAPFRILRIDPDEIRESMPGYLGGNAEIFQRGVTKIVERVVDRAFSKSISFLLDGTFSNKEVAMRNVDRALRRGRLVDVLFVYQEPGSTWRLIKEREEITGRSIPFDAFLRHVIRSRQTVALVKDKYGDSINLSVFISNESAFSPEFAVSLDAFDRLVPNHYDEDHLRQLILDSKEGDCDAEASPGRSFP